MPTLDRRSLLALGAAALFIRPALAQGAPVIEGGCDTHVHIIGPLDRYPMVPGRAYTPPQNSVAALNALHKSLGLTRTVLIQPSFYGTDNRAMLDALKELGSAARGIAVLAPDVPDAELKSLDGQGVRGIRINIETAGGRDPKSISEPIKAFGKRLAPLGWHIQIFAALPVIVSIAPDLADLPVPVVFDHFGMPDFTKGTEDPQFQTLLKLVSDKKAFVKLSAPYRISKAPGYTDVAPFAKALIAAGPDRMLWASDWPHTAKAPGAKPTDISPFSTIDDPAVFKLFSTTWCPDEATRRTILVDTPAKLYRF